MGGPRLVPFGVPRRSTLGDVLQEIGRLDARALRGLESYARWLHSQLTAPPPLLRAKHLRRTQKRRPSHVGVRPTRDHSA